MGKATNFKFCTHILSIDRNKSPLQISGKVAVGIVRTLEIFQGIHVLGESHGHRCDSSAFLYIVQNGSKRLLLSLQWLLVENVIVSLLFVLHTLYAAFDP